MSSLKKIINELNKKSPQKKNMRKININNKNNEKQNNTNNIKTVKRFTESPFFQNQILIQKKRENK